MHKRWFIQNSGYFPPAFVMEERVSRSKARRLNHQSKQKRMETQLLKEKRLRVAAERQGDSWKEKALMYKRFADSTIVEDQTRDPPL